MSESDQAFLFLWELGVPFGWKLDLLKSYYFCDICSSLGVTYEN